MSDIATTNCIIRFLIKTSLTILFASLKDSVKAFRMRSVVNGCSTILILDPTNRSNPEKFISVLFKTTTAGSRCAILKSCISLKANLGKN